MAVKKRSAKRKITKIKEPEEEIITESKELNYEKAKSQYYSSNGKGSNLLIALLIVVSFFAGYLFFKVKSMESVKTTATAPVQQQQPPAPVQVTKDQIKKLFGNDYIHFGDASKKILFVEITDPSCPYCHIAGGENNELSKSTGNFAYVSDGGTYTPPVTEIRKLVDDGKASLAILYGNGHGNGRLGTQALYCAQDKGKFWEVHDLLMSNDGYNLLNNTVQNNKEKIPDLVNFLSSAVDSNYLSGCLTSGKMEAKLTRDEKVDTELGFQGTPHFFVNTTAVNGAQDWKAFEPIVKPLL